jgi:hypothetical protein
MPKGEISMAESAAIDYGILPVGKTKRDLSLARQWILCIGGPKIGKTTTWSKAPGVLFLKTEEGQGELELAGLSIADEIERTPTGPGKYKEKFIGRSGWETIKTAIHDLEHRQHEYHTVCIDTGEGAYDRCRKYHCVMNGVEYENDGVFGYGKGVNLIERDFAETLQWLRRLPLGVIIISHTVEREFNDDFGKAYTKIVTALPPRAMKVVNGMVDMILYFTLDGKGNRIIKTQPTAYYDAGSRISGLPETVPMDYGEFAQAYYRATGTGPDGKAQLLERIHKGENVLGVAKIDSFDVERRRGNARTKHAGNEDLNECEVGQLEKYLRYLTKKYRTGGKNDGTSA